MKPIQFFCYLKIFKTNSTYENMQVHSFWLTVPINVFRHNTDESMTQCCRDCVDNLCKLVTILRKTYFAPFLFFGGGCSITAGQPELFPTSKTIKCIFQDFNATMYYHQIKKMFATTIHSPNLPKKKPITGTFLIICNNCRKYGIILCNADSTTVTWYGDDDCVSA